MTCGYLLIGMLDILLLNCYPFVFFLGYKGEYCGPLFFFFTTKRGRDITVITLDIGYLHVDYFGY